MALRYLGKDPDSDHGNSPTVWEDGDSYVVQGWRIIDTATLGEIGDVPSHETVVRIPKRLMAVFPEVSGAGKALERTVPALLETGYRVDMELWTVAANCNSKCHQCHATCHDSN